MHRGTNVGHVYETHFGLPLNEEIFKKQTLQRKDSIHPIAG